MARKYDMGARGAAMEHTREAILDAVVALDEAWYDEVTLGDIARRAGVSQQTVVNHFGSKMQVYLAAIAERYAPQISAAREVAVPGDVESVVGAVVDDYERSGDRTWRLIALAARLEELRAVVVGGRRAHQAFVDRAFAPALGRPGSAARDRRVTLLSACLDVTMWHQLRRADGLPADQVRTHLVHLVRGVLANEP